MGLIRTIASSVGSVLGNKAGDLLGKRIEASLSGSEESDGDDEGESGQSRRAAFVDRLRSKLLAARAKVDELQSDDEDEESEESAREDEDGGDDEHDGETEDEGSEESPDEQSEGEGDDPEESEGIGGRVSNALPETDRLAQATTSVLDEFSGGPEAEETENEGETDESSPETAGQRVGEAVGQRLGTMITRALGDSDDEEPS